MNPVTEAVSALSPGPTNTLADVAGLRVGHATVVGEGWLSGTTVVLAGAEGAVCGVDVRGGGPGTRETDLLDPRNVVERVHAVVLSGGSAYGLAAAHGVVERLAAAGVGFRVGTAAHEVVPIVPAAIVFDLGRGGDFGCRPGAEQGAAAYDDALSGAGRPVPLGCVGAGTGAVAGTLKGGVGSASAVLPSGAVVAALAVVNAAGSTVDPATGELYGARLGLRGEFAEMARSERRTAGPAHAPADAPGPVPFNTTIGVVATDAALTKAQCARLASVAHDGMARAIRPVHTLVDGDAVFGLASGDRPAPADLVEAHHLDAAAGDCFSRAVAHAMLHATSVATPAGSWPSYRDTYLGA